jgi:hypothetical protein
MAMDRNELDSHADTVVGGPNCVLISDPDEYVQKNCGTVEEWC